MLKDLGRTRFYWLHFVLFIHFLTSRWGGSGTTSARCVGTLGEKVYDLEKRRGANTVEIADLQEEVDSSPWRCLHARCCVVGLTHTVTHTGKRADGDNGAKSTADLILLEQKGPESVEKQGLEGHKLVGKDEVGSSNLPSSSRKHLKSSDFGCFLFCLCAILAGTE